MPARQDVRLDAESLAGKGALELQGEEPVVCASEHPDIYRPPIEVADRREHRACLRPLVRRACRRNLRRHVVQKVDGQVEVPAVAALVRGSASADINVFTNTVNISRSKSGDADSSCSCRKRAGSILLGAVIAGSFEAL
jgi:hypothetical protein